MDFLAELFLDGLSIEERLANRGIDRVGSSSTPVVKKRWQRWQQVCGGETRFNHRLAWLHLEEQDLERLLNSDNSLPLHIPPWGEFLQTVMTKGMELGDDCLSYLSTPVPFQELYVPFVTLAQEKLQVPSQWSKIAIQDALAGPVQQLFNFLAGLSAELLLAEFSYFRQAKQPLMANLMFYIPNYDSKDLYQEFVCLQRQDRLQSFFRNYPALARLLATITLLWVEATQELLDRLTSDYELLQKELGVAGKIVGIKPSLGDPHRGRRTVTLVEFAEGQKLIYKPRSLQAEVAIARWVDWLNARGCDLRAVRVIDCCHYGWMEFIEYENPQSKDYYWRLGQLLGLLYLLDTYDCHWENLIPHGDYPYLVDGETILRTELQQDLPPGLEAMHKAQDILQRSVIGVGILPNWEQVGEELQDLSVLGVALPPIPVTEWQDINTDKMRLGKTVLSMSADAKPAPVREFIGELTAGFRLVCGKVCAHREEAPLSCLENIPTRFVYRPTRVYAQLFGNAVRSKYLRHGIDFSIELERLYVPLLWHSDPHPHQPIVEAEIAALSRGDIPLFWTNSSSSHLWADNPFAPPLLTNVLAETGLERVKRKIADLNVTTIEEQVQLMKLSLLGVEPQLILGEKEVEVIDSNPLLKTEVRTQAVRLGQELERRAIRGRDGSYTWLGFTLLGNSGKVRLQPLDFSLYDGVGGVAVFLAALYAETGESQWRDLAYGAIRPLMYTWELSDVLLPRFLGIIQQIGIGGSKGLGSIVYSLTKVGELLPDPDLLVLADRFAQLLTADLIAQDKFYDVMSGSAGMILALLCLHRLRPQDHLLELALQCGDHLLHHRTPTPTGHYSWHNPHLPHLTGFSHGATGIAYALLELYSYTKREEFLTSAQAAIAFEEAVFIPQRQNYPDFRATDPTECMNSWCHGASGITLGRLSCLKTLDTTDLRTSIDRGLQTTLGAGVQTLDHLCCGNFGRMETLLVAMQVLQRSELEETVKLQLAHILRRAQRLGGFYLLPQVAKGIFNPGFFQGVAGIGYQLLRLSKPDRYPSILLWQ